MSDQPILKRKTSTESTPDFCPHIEQVEVYIEKSRALGLGQRLLWHMDKFNKKLALPYIPDSKDLYLQPLSVKITQGVRKPNQAMLYTPTSNTVFYYNDYKVVLLLDFSQSTSTVYPGQVKSYIDKMKDTLEVIIKNLLFQIKNQFHKKTEEPVKKETPKTTAKAPMRFDFNKAFSASETSQGESDNHIRARIFPIDEESQSGANNNMLDSPLKPHEDQMPDEAPHKKLQHTQYNEPKPAYFPKIYLSIVVSGLPPGNNTKLIVHNQKIDHRDLAQMLKSIETRLINIERHLRQNVQQKKTEDTTRGSLQVHLENAQYILDLMPQDAKPLLVFFTDCTNSLLELHDYKSRAKVELFDNTFGQLDKSIHKLHLSDCRIISIDLQNENKTCNTFGYINHENELFYLTQITQGIHFTYSGLMEIDAKMNGVPVQSITKDRSAPTAQSSAQLFARDGTVKFVLENGSLVIQNSMNQIKPMPETPSQKHSTLLFGGGEKSKKGQIPHQVQQINALQKVMFARACNNRMFMDSPEIKQFILVQSMAGILSLDQKFSSDLSLPQLLFEGQVVPLLQTDHLAQYYIEKVGFASLCEFRSKMGFKYMNVKFHQMSDLTNRQSFMQESQQSNQIKQISYQYLVDSQIKIECILTPDPFRAAVTATYNVHAPASTIRSLHHSAEKCVSMRDRLRVLVKSIQIKDQHFQLLEQISNVIRKVQILFQNPPASKYKDKNRIGKRKSKLTTNPFAQDNFDVELKRKKSKVKVKKETQTQIQTEEEARQFLVQNKQLFEKLTTMISLNSRMYQWKCYFRYTMITIVTQAASVCHSQQLLRNPASQAFWKRSIEEEWFIEHGIEESLLQAISSFTTLTLDNLHFMQVFEDSSTVNQYKLLDHSLSGLPNQQETDQQSDVYFGFCLIRVEMKATNVAEVHFGFYQVGPKQRLQYLKAFKKFINTRQQKGLNLSYRNNSQNQETDKSQRYFKCFEKKLATIMLETPKRYRYSLAYLNRINEQEFIQESDEDTQRLSQGSEESQPLDLLVFRHSQDKSDLKTRRVSFLKSGMMASQLFHKNEWKWKGNNSETTREHYFRILEQRLADGFKVINRMQGTTEFYHMIKVLRANKDRQQVKVGRNKSKHSDELKVDQAAPEKVEILIQFLISIDDAESTISQELYMEQETAFFIIEKTAPSSNRTSNVSSTNSDQNNPAGNEASCKEFFDQMSDYLYQVDKQLYVQINTYHHIVKNSIFKQIQQGEFSVIQQDTADFSNAIKEAVCYFRNTTATTKRQRRDRESQMCQKMQSLQREWKQYLKQRYPEMFNKSDPLDMIDVQQLIDCGSLFGKQFLQVPKIEPYDAHISKTLCDKFIQAILVQLSEFTDLKLSADLANDDRQSDVYFKLVSKDILMMIQVKVVREQKKNDAVRFRDFEQNDKLLVEYYKFDQSMIRITGEGLTQSHIKKYFATHAAGSARQKYSYGARNNIMDKGGRFKSVRSSGLLNKMSSEFGNIQASGRTHLSFYKKNRACSIGIQQPSDDVSHDSKQDEFSNLGFVLDKYDNDSDQDINQIDQVEEILMFYQNNRQKKILNQLQFETKVKTILNNFVNYLTQTYEKIYSTTLIIALYSCEGQEAKVAQHDIAKALSIMGEVTFMLDLSFAAVMHRHCDTPDLAPHLKLVDSATDLLFFETISRNFCACPSDPTIMIYRSNQADHVDNDVSPVHIKTNAEFDIFGDFRYNLQGTKDAYSDQEEEDEVDDERPDRAQRPLHEQQVYRQCQNLILKTEMVIKDTKGQIQIKRPVTEFSDIFSQSKTMPEVLQNIKERVSITEPQYKPTDDLHMAMFENTDNVSNEGSQQQNNQFASVEIWLTFFTIPQYTGLFRAKDIDFIQNETKVMVNDDKMEDLIRVCKIVNPENEKHLPPEQTKIVLSGELYTPVKKRQVIKSIPYFFEIESESLKVFYLEEIQRKSIYGVLRRMYAVIAQSFTEMVALQRPHNEHSFLLVQKYFGYLLSNQRSSLKIPLFDQKSLKRFSQMWDTLRTVLESGQILSVNVHRNMANEKLNLYYIVSTRQARNFMLTPDWHQLEEVRLNSGGFSIPFWVMFVIEESEKGLNLNFIFHIPKYKYHHDESTVVSQLRALSDQLRVKVKTLLLLNEVSEKFNITKELRLPSSTGPFLGREVDSQLIIDTASAADNSSSPLKIPSPVPLTKKKPSASKLSAFTRKFQKNAATASSQPSQPLALNQRDSSNSMSTSSVNAPFIEKTPPSSNSQARRRSVSENIETFTLENFTSHSQVIPTSHCLTIEQSLKAIQNSTALYTFRVDGMQNAYVFKEGNIVSLMRLSTYHADQILMELFGVYPPSELQIQRLSQCVKSIILEYTFKKIALETLQRRGNICFEDFEYIKNQDEKVLMLFPIHEAVTDPMCFLKILQQTLQRRLLIPIKVAKKQTNQLNSFNSQNSLPNTSSMLNSKSSFFNDQRREASEVISHTSFVDDFKSLSFVKSQSLSLIEADAGPEQPLTTTVSDSTLLFNYNWSCDQGSQTQLNQFFGQALALVHLQILQSFDFQQFNVQTTEMTQDFIIDFLSRHVKDTFDVAPCLFDQKMNGICNSYRQKGLHPIYSYQPTDKDPDQQQKTSLPYIYTSHKVVADEVQYFFKEQPLSSLGLNCQQPQQSDTTMYCQVLINVCNSAGQFNRDLFIKQLILTFNQALIDTKIELNLYSQIRFSKPQITVTVQPDFAVLRNLFDDALNAHSFSTKKQKLDVQCTQENALKILQSIHQFYYQEVLSHLSMLQVCMQDRVSLVAAMMTFYFVIKVMIDGALVKKIVVDIPVTCPIDLMKLTDMLALHMDQSDSLVTYSIVVGQFPCVCQQVFDEPVVVINMVTEHNKQPSQLSSSPHKMENDSEIRTMETGLSHMNRLKLSESLSQTIMLSNSKQGRYMQHRSFFMILDMANEVELVCYNMQPVKIKVIKDLIRLVNTSQTTEQPDLAKIVVGIQEARKPKEPVLTSKLALSRQMLSEDAPFTQIRTNPVFALGKKGKKKKKRARKQILAEKMDSVDQPREVEEVYGSVFWKFYADYFKEDVRLKKLND